MSAVNAGSGDLNILLRGQSNADLLLYYGAIDKVRDEVQSLLGFDGTTHKVNLIAVDNAANGDNSLVGGTSFIGDWVQPDGKGGWAPAAREQGLLNLLSGEPAAVKAAPTAVVWLHNEYDSTNTALSAGEWSSAVRADASWVRSALGQSPATTPYLFVNAIPYGGGTNDGNQAIKLGMQQLIADPGFNAGYAAQANDVNMNAWDNGTYGGPHMSADDANMLVDRLARSIAESFANQALPGSPLAQAGGKIDNLGPQAVAASPVAGQPRQLLVTVQQDDASGLKPLDPVAAQGVGWLVLAADGTQLAATGAQVVDPTHLLLSFPTAVPSTAATLNYAWGYGRLAAAATTPQGTPGQGNAVYDSNGLPIWTAASGVPIGATAPVTPASLGTPSVPSIQQPASTAGSSSDNGNQTLWTTASTNTLQGGSGHDTFLIDPSTPQATVQNFHPGDVLGVLGLDWNTGHATWTQGTDAQGNQAAVLQIDRSGSGQAGASVALPGVSLASAQALTTSAGTLNGLPLVTWHD